MKRTLKNLTGLKCRNRDLSINFATSKYGTVSDKATWKIAKAEELRDTKGIRGMKVVAGFYVVNIYSDAVITVPLRGCEIWTVTVIKLGSGIFSLCSVFMPLYKMRSW